MSTTETSPKISDHDVIYTLRTANQNQTQLNVMADQKANILIGTMGIMISVLFSKAFTATNISTQMLIPISLFMLMEVSALMFAILVLMPKTVGKIKTTHIDKIQNPLFFGLFTQFPEKEYVDYITQNMDNDISARRFLIHDIYQNGLVLKKKYKLLKLAYIFTVLGVVLPAVFFGIFLWFK